MGTFGRATPRHDRKIARVLEVLEDGPLTGRQIAAALPSSYQAAMFYVRILLDSPRKIRVSGYVRSTGRAACVYELGAAPDAPFKRERGRDRATCPDRRMQVLELLAAPCSMQMLVQRVGITDRQVATYVRKLRAEGLVYIAYWRRSAGNPIPYYKTGDGDDAAPLPRQTRQHYTERAMRKRTSTGWAAALGI